MANVISFTAIKNTFTNSMGSQTLPFIENNEEILNDEKTSSMLVLGLQYFKTMLLGFFLAKIRNLW